AAATQGSGTRSGRVTPSSSSVSPSRATAPAPCTTRVGTSTARTASTSTGISTLLLAYQARERVLPPALGALQVVEREDMEPGDVAARLPALVEPLDQRVGIEVSAKGASAPAS